MTGLQPNILDLSRSALEEWLKNHGLKRFSLTQILQWLYRKRVASFAEMTNLSKESRTLLAEHFSICPLEIGGRHHSAENGTTKYLFHLFDGHAVEGVLMSVFSKGSRHRRTLCISTQVGCAMGCKFCRTGGMKLVRNLTLGEILGQILAVQGDLAGDVLNSERAAAGSDSLRPAVRRERSHPGNTDGGCGVESGISPRITNVVMMGMGEPFHNYETVLGALKIMTDDFGLGISQRKITVSTVGLAHEIERFGRESKVKLALSLNATTDEGRRDLMPIARKYPLERVIEACRRYAVESGQKVTFEYVMMDGVNDSPEDAKRLARIGSHVPCKINLIPYNEYPRSPFKRPPEEKIRPFFTYLADRHFQVNIRYSKGLDVMAACGQLAVSPSPRHRGEGGPEMSEGPGEGDPVDIHP